MTVRSTRRTPLAALLASLIVSASTAAALAAHRPAPLPYSSADAHVIQRQAPAATCHERGTGLYSLPDPRCTPGALNPAVKQSTLATTICKRGWTSTVRPPESVTAREKRASLAAYGDNPSSPFEYDHLVSLELGGAVNDARNLWPEPDYPVKMGFYLNPKDRLERALNRMVCHGAMPLAQAQVLIASDWVSAYRRYG